MSAGLVDRNGNLQLYDGTLRFRAADGTIAADGIDGDDYATWIGEATLRDSYLKAPYFKPQGFPDGVYRVGPLARLNAADRCGTPVADAELVEFRERFGVAGAQRVPLPLRAADRDRVCAGTDRGAARRPADSRQARPRHGGRERTRRRRHDRGASRDSIHHYKVDDDGAIVKANLIVATGHNNLAIGRASSRSASVLWTARSSPKE